MSKTTIKPNDETVPIATGEGALLSYLDRFGRFPPVTLSIKPLSNPDQEIFLDKFISYSFLSSILIPVDTFTCEVFYEPVRGILRPREGDIFILRANGIPLATGIIDQLDMDTDASTGTKLTVQGRDLLGTWEDQDAVSINSTIAYANKYSVSQVIRVLAQDSRIDPNKIIFRNMTKTPYLFATQPGESKLSALQRYIESLDVYFWMNGDGRIIVGKPDVLGVNGRKGTFYLLKQKRRANVLSMRSMRAASTVPGLIVPLWNGQESTQSRNRSLSPVVNKDPRVQRLMSLGHRIPKAVVVSTPEGATPQDLSEINALIVGRQNAAQQKLSKAGASTILQAYAKREMAKQNMKALGIQCTVAGHYNDSAEPLVVDQTYRVQYDVDEIDEDMFLYEVEYSMSENEGQRTRMGFCTQYSLVSDVRAY